MDDNENTIDAIRKFFNNWQTSSFKWTFRDLADYYDNHGCLPGVAASRGVEARPHPANGKLGSVVISVDHHGVSLSFELDQQGVVARVTSSGERVCSWAHHAAFDPSTPAAIVDEATSAGYDGLLADGLELFWDAYSLFIEDCKAFFETERAAAEAHTTWEVKEIFAPLVENAQRVREFTGKCFTLLTRHPERVGELAEWGVYYNSGLLDLAVTSRLDRPANPHWPLSHYRIDATYSGRIVFRLSKTDGRTTHHFTIFDLRLDDLQLDPDKAAEEARKGMEHAQFDFEECEHALSRLVPALLVRITMLGKMDWKA